MQWVCFPKVLKKYSIPCMNTKESQHCVCKWWSDGCLLSDHGWAWGEWREGNWEGEGVSGLPPWPGTHILLHVSGCLPLRVPWPAPTNQSQVSHRKKTFIVMQMYFHFSKSYPTPCTAVTPAPMGLHWRTSVQIWTVSFCVDPSAFQSFKKIIYIKWMT